LLNSRLIDPNIIFDAQPAAQPGAHAPAGFISPEYDEEIVADQIAYLTRTEDMSLEEMESHQLERLRKLLVYAGMHVPYWRSLFKKLNFIPSKGEILIDETPLSDYKQKSYRLKVGYVPQDSVLFHSSIRDNLLWSSESSSEDELWEALDAANASLFIKKLPQGMDTVVGDRGTRLSGGQRQRIALARALLRKPEFLILDEATSALDSESEKLIKESIEALSKDTTILVVAHRQSTIENADQVYVMKNGIVVEEGSFSELSIKSNGILNEMLATQMTS
jgi:ABC-type bacteriocin/lantibiotic exporter with double-glycine peptidase domain